MVIDAVLGLLFFAGGLVSLARRAAFVRRAVPSTGIVVRCEPVYEALPVHPSVPHAIKRERPMVRYRTRDDAEVLASLPTVHEGRHVPGDPIRVRYDPRTPHQVAIPSSGYWLVPSLFLVLGAVLIAVALLVR